MKPGPRSERSDALRRMLFIVRALERGEEYSALDLARHYGLSSKTIRRDIHFLRSEMGAEIDYDYKRQCYRLHAPLPF